MYAVIEADGYFGDVAIVCEVYVERAKAIKSVSHDRRWQVIEGSGFTKGEKIYRDTIGSIYHRVDKA